MLHTSYSKAKGFTLVELMVTIGIFVIMTALILARYNSFGTGTILTNMAYDIALTIRQAQTYGLSVKSNEGAGFNAAYGVHFDPNLANFKKFILFADGNADGIYASGDDITAYNLKQGAKISSTCVSTGSDCSNGVIAVSDSADPLIVDVTFKRPDPKATICARNNEFNNCNWAYAKITISSADNTSRRDIFVTKVGQISLVTNP
jgi:prepilin-type N-terminal cleavage/methylation domain-containing protein